MQAESWAFALNAQSLELLVGKGIFWTRTCKVCHGDEGIVVASEYGMSKAILEAGFNFATLMSRYAGPSLKQSEPKQACVHAQHVRQQQSHPLGPYSSLTPSWGLNCFLLSESRTASVD